MRPGPIAILVTVAVVGGLGACSPGIDLTKEETATGTACAVDPAAAAVPASGSPPLTKVSGSFTVPGLREVLGIAYVDGVLWTVGQTKTLGQYFLVAQDADGSELGRWPVPRRPFGLEVIDGSAYTLDLMTGSPMRIALTNGEVFIADPVSGEPVNMRVGADGGRVYLPLNLRSAIAVVDMQTGRTVCDVPVISGNNAIAVSGDGIRIFRGYSGGGGSMYHAGLEVLHRQTGETLALMDSGSPMRSLALAQDQSMLAALSSAGKKLTLIDPETLTQLGVVDLPGEGDAVYWHDGYAYVRAFGPGIIWVIDVNAEQVLATIDLPFMPYAMTFTDDAAYVAGEQIVVLSR